MIVRVVDYTVPDRKGERIRLIISILDPAQATAEELARCYHDRWEAETGIDQLKTHLRGPGRILRSRTRRGLLPLSHLMSPGTGPSTMSRTDGT